MRNRDALKTDSPPRKTSERSGGERAGRHTIDLAKDDEDSADALRRDRDASTAWIEVGAAAPQLDLATAVRAGLANEPKTLPSQFFYDDVGSRLFEEICDLPEYYLTRTEAEILEDAAPDLAARLPEIGAIVELGSGSATKTEILLQAFESDGRSLCYAPIDVSRSALEESVARLEERHPGLDILAAVAEYESGLAEGQSRKLGPSLTLWLGSSIGNLEKPAATGFLGQLCQSMTSEDRMLVGVDLRKDRNILESAYNDAQGVTGRFNLNLLTRINRELGGEFELATFRHRVHYDEPSGSVQSFLESQTDQSVRIEALDTAIDFRRGERIHTEDSHKYSVEEIDALAAEAGFVLERRYSDADNRFTLNLFRRAA